VPSETVTALQGIKNKLGKDVEVIYEKALNFTNDTLLAYEDISRQYAIGEGTPGFKAEYYNNTELKGEPIVQTESNLEHSWQEGEAVVGDIRANNFSARYTTYYSQIKTVR
jgi:hypothetical protein